MTEDKEPQVSNNIPPSEQHVEDPGLTESFGSFPVWILRVIQMITPDFLISKIPPEKKKTRI